MSLNLSEQWQGSIESLLLEDALHKSQNFIQQVTETTPNILYIYDLVEQKNVYVSHAVTTILGHSPESLCELGPFLLTSLLHPDDAREFANHQQKFLPPKTTKFLRWSIGCSGPMENGAGYAHRKPFSLEILMALLDKF